MGGQCQLQILAAAVIQLFEKPYQKHHCAFDVNLDHFDRLPIVLMY